MAPKQKGKRVRRDGSAAGHNAKLVTQRNGARSKAKPAYCPIVGIGGSAGGFEAAMELLRHMPANNGMAFVVVQHLDPHHASRLAGLLGKVTPMPVIELESTTTPRPNTVYVQPPNKCVIMEDNALTLIPRTERLNLAIDHFFESLAEERGIGSIGVVLSGTGSDGTAGLRAIKAAGGLTFAQNIESAKFGDMPRNAIHSGSVDAALPPHEIARELHRVAGHPYVRARLHDGAEPIETDQEELNELGRIYLVLRKHTGVDFTTYKQSTLKRRIYRRMVLHRLERFGQYARFLHDNKKELDALFDDLLINVTRFFRDERVFRVLQKRFLPALLKDKNRRSLRVWVPGCATGEEVYSLAICIMELLRKNASRMTIQIFGTDLSEAAIERARAGVYSAAIEKDVSPARLKRFFEKRDGNYQIARNVRELCTFARQNITADPPFSRLDLISCRNVLIYLGMQLHRRCIPQFHYALNAGGYLILGPAETVGPFQELFEPVDRQSKIFRKKILPGRRAVELDAYPAFQRSHPAAESAFSSAGFPNFSTQLLQAGDRIMLNAYAPAAVIVDAKLHVQQFRGRTELYLEHTAGPASLNVLQLVRRSLVADLRATIRNAMKSERPARKERALVKLDGKTVEVNIEVVPFKITASDDPWFLIIFDETTKGIKPAKLPRALGKTAAQRELLELRRELDATKGSLQSILQEHEATNEELKAASEEIESSNEELQSTNEELETAKEELQSTNEELTTLNEELSNRNLEMMQVNSDLNNLLSSIQLPIVMVDNTLTVRRATPLARQAFNILSTDIGRPLSELRPNVDIPDLEKILREVIQTLAMQEREVTDKEGHGYLLRVRPYRTSDNKIDGAVIALVDIDGRRHERKERPRAKQTATRK
jgi:two-component system CheB/CheR fusion protein